MVVAWKASSWRRDTIAQVQRRAARTSREHLWPACHVLAWLVSKACPGQRDAWMPRSSPGHAPRATGPTSGPRVASYSWYACVIHGGSTVLAAPVRRPQPRPAPSADTRRAAWQASSTRGRLLAPRRTRAPTHLNGISWIWSARGHPTAAGGRSDDHCPNPETSSPRPAGQLSRDSCRL
jgi:hypothetical protein